MTCKLMQILPSGEMKIFTCDEMRDRHNELKNEFRQNNCTEAFAKDSAFDAYCKSIDSFLEGCTCMNISYTCDKCKPEEHEGYFCRCESRNIALAKQLRKEGKSTWLNKKESISPSIDK